MTHENAEDLAANVFVGRSIKHRSTIGFAHRSYGCSGVARMTVLQSPLFIQSRALSA